MRIAVASLGACLGCQLTLLDMGESIFQFIGDNQLVYVPYLMDKKSPSECDLAIIEGGIRDERQSRRPWKLRAPPPGLSPAVAPSTAVSPDWATRSRRRACFAAPTTIIASRICRKGWGGYSPSIRIWK